MKLCRLVAIVPMLLPMADGLSAQSPTSNKPRAGKACGLGEHEAARALRFVPSGTSLTNEFARPRIDLGFGCAIETVVAAPDGPAAGHAIKTYVVKAGDTVARIATRHGITPAELAKVNNLSDPDLIRLGQTLMIPAGQSTELPSEVAAGPATATAAPGRDTPETKVVRVHLVAKGETFSHIARKYGVTVKSLSEANPSINPKVLRVGQKVNLVPDAKPGAPDAKPGAPDAKAEVELDADRKPAPSGTRTGDFLLGIEMSRPRRAVDPDSSDE